VRLICEYCDKGSLREALDLGAFKLPDGGVNYPAVLDTAVEIVTAVLHLHQRNVLHSDLKVGNSVGSNKAVFEEELGELALATS
jgi:serine/threonine protein kinase